MNPNIEQTIARPDDTALNIPRGRSNDRANSKVPRSMSPSPMDDSSTPSEGDYAERVAAQNNMEVEVSHTSPPPRTYHRTTSLCPLLNLHAPSMRRRLTLHVPFMRRLTLHLSMKLIRQRNPLLPR